MPLGVSPDTRTELLPPWKGLMFRSTRVVLKHPVFILLSQEVVVEPRERRFRAQALKPERLSNIGIPSWGIRLVFEGELDFNPPDISQIDYVARVNIPGKLPESSVFGIVQIGMFSADRDTPLATFLCDAKHARYRARDGRLLYDGEAVVQWLNDAIAWMKAQQGGS